jgi:transglutaminase-like putative cysteine protease
VNLALNKHVLIFLLLSIGLIVLPHSNNIPPIIFGYFCLLLIWRFIAVWRVEYIPSKLLLTLLTIIGIALIISRHQGLLGRDAGTTLFITALALKLMEIKQERDLYLVTYLAFVVASSQFLYTQSLLMAAYIIFVCCVLLATLVCINSHKPQTLAALKTASLLLAQAIPLTIALFLLFPRIEAPRWMLFEDEHKARTGLGDTMEAGSISELITSDELVFRVTFEGAVPPPSERYWRGPVLARTDGKRWFYAGNRGFKPDLKQFDGQRYSYTLLMEAQEKNWVFALELPVATSANLTQNSNYQLLTNSDSTKRSEYKIVSYTHYNTGELSESERDNALQLPAEPSDRMKQLVTQLHGFDSSANNFIAQLLNHFRQEKFYYTLTPPLMENNPIESFLFETRHGFCSHYASAFVYLMRVANIPARVVTGYQGGEFNKLGNFLEIRQADAHAWAEVWISGRGWIRIDPTAAIAPERIEQETVMQQSTEGLISFSNQTSIAMQWLKNTRQLWRNVDYQWQRWVINYNSANQLKLLSSWGIADIKQMLHWLLFIGGAIAALLTAALLYQQHKTIDPILACYNRFTAKLAKVGLIKASHEGAKDFAARAVLVLPEKSASIEQITQLFIELRYGRHANNDSVKQLQQLIRNFKVGVK